MKNKNIFGMLSVVLTLMISLILVNQSVFAAAPTNATEFEEFMKERCDAFQGDFEIVSPGITYCRNIPAALMTETTCSEGTYAEEFGKYIGEDPYIYAYSDSCVTSISEELKGMDKQGLAKINTIPSEAYLGGTIKVEGMGAPSFLRLKAAGVTYKLPVVPGSIMQLDNGTFTAEFYTIDPVTSQPLVAPGTYLADLFGSNGPAGSQFEITISR
jgi:hypothetical protein